MYILDELLKHDIDGKPSVDIPSCPVLVFVDIKDEKLGGRLYNEFCYRLNKKQIVGGDDVVNWILGVICDLRLPESPSIVPISHGTENNIPLSFGWVKCLIHVVKANAFKSRSNVRAFLLVKH
ncbi:diacylglycerol kinase 6-like isoform X1 [Malus sylvestris]|uniref:diacylglycerol kinase 6-like isoform X1 n=2 Tax=Malus sylvestris TaxID=3752 RepID=UPI0021AC1029|nr:diacylglycerol kinase 6-like isoform X1 [Malus sylvestris]